MFTRDNLDRSLAAIGAPIALSIYEDLMAAYTEAGRYHHTDKHISECLTQFELVRSQAQRPAEIEVALWFHDAVYDTRQSDNEERSAEWVQMFLATSNVDGLVIERIVQLIMATKTHEPHDVDAEIMLDIDLGILGASQSVFEEYDAAIRQEYHWVPEDQFRNGRAQILSAFLERDVIYNTEYFQSRYEQQARANLARKIRELRLV